MTKCKQRWVALAILLGMLVIGFLPILPIFIFDKPDPVQTRINDLIQEHNKELMEWENSYQYGFTNGLVTGIDALMLLSLENELKGITMNGQQMRDLIIERYMKRHDL